MYIPYSTHDGTLAARDKRQRSLRTQRSRARRRPGPSPGPTRASPRAPPRLCGARRHPPKWRGLILLHPSPSPCAGSPGARTGGVAFSLFDTSPRPPATAPPRLQPCSHRMDFACTGGGRIQDSVRAGELRESGLAQADQSIMGTESAEHARRRGGGAGMRAAKVSSAHLMKRYVENPKTGAEEEVDLPHSWPVTKSGSFAGAAPDTSQA